MKIQETYIVWSNRYSQYIKLYQTFSNGTIRWYTEINSNLMNITFEDAAELLDPKK